MTIAARKLEALFQRVRNLPEDRLGAAVELLEDLVRDPLPLTDEEREVLEPALARALAGEYATADEMAELLDKPWG